MNTIISKSLKDILSLDVIIFVIQIAIASTAITLFLAFNIWHTLVSIISSYLSWIPWNWLQTTGVTVITIFVAYVLFTIIIAILTAIYSEKLLIKIAKKNYPTVQVVGTPSITMSILLTIKASFIFLGLFMLTFVLLFIPIIGQIIMLYLWSILLKEPTIYDVGALFIDDKNILKSKRKKTRLLAMIASLFNYIPIVNIFAPLFAQIMFLHHILGED